MEARRAGYSQTSTEFRRVSHDSAYEKIDPSEAYSAWISLTKPVSKREVRPTYAHTSVSTEDSTTDEYEKFIAFHNSKKKKIVSKKVQERLERDAEDIFSWLSQQHGMWMTHIELEYIIEETNVATNNLYVERDHYKGKCYLKAVNYCEYVKCTT